MSDTMIDKCLTNFMLNNKCISKKFEAIDLMIIFDAKFNQLRNKINSFDTLYKTRMINIRMHFTFSTLLLSLNWNKIAWNIKLSDIRNRIISIEFMALELMITQFNGNKNYRL